MVVYGCHFEGKIYAFYLHNPVSVSRLHEGDTLTLSQTSSNSKLSSANSLSLEECKICRLGNGLKAQWEKRNCS